MENIVPTSKIPRIHIKGASGTVKGKSTLKGYSRATSDEATGPKPRLHRNEVVLFFWEKINKFSA